MQVRCQKCGRVLGYGTGKVTRIWCTPPKTAAHYEARSAAFDAAMDNEDVDVAREVKMANREV